PSDTRGDRDRAESRAQPRRDPPAARATPGDRAATEQLRDVAEEKLPVLREAIERAEIVRRWLEDAARCCCPTLDDCPLFEDPVRLPERSSLVLRELVSTAIDRLRRRGVGEPGERVRTVAVLRLRSAQHESA